MSAKIKYSDEPIGPVKIVADFLPSPEELAFKEDTVKVTISLSRESIDFFKREARKHRTPIPEDDTQAPGLLRQGTSTIDGGVRLV